MALFNYEPERRKFVWFHISFVTETLKGYSAVTWVV